MYGTSKSATNALTRIIATQYGRQGIRAVGVSPSVTINKHNVTAREGRPEDIANLVSFLASDKAGFIIGITIQVDGGLTAHFPTYAEDLAAQAGA